MGEIARRIDDFAGGRRFLIARREALGLGATDKYLRYQVDRGSWLRVHPGVYQVDRRPLDWKSKLLAAVLACGPTARASHRAALIVWDLDGIRSSPLEVTMPFGNLAVPKGVIVHRSRRPTPVRVFGGIAASGPERALSRSVCLPA